jgi:hypothetical protein
MKFALRSRNLVALFMLLLILISSTACVERPEIKSRVWIDFPLEGGEYREGKPIQIVSHLYAKDGVNELSLSVNGVELSKGPPFTPGETFVEFNQEWVPAQPGPHTIEVALYDADGEISRKAQVNVTILGKVEKTEEEEEPSPSPTPTTEDTPEPPKAKEPTPTPTHTPKPEVIPPTPTWTTQPDTTPPTISNMTASQDSIVEEGCKPNRVMVSVSVSDASGISEVKLYHRIVKGGQNGTWLTPNMNATGGGNYQLTLGPDQFKKSMNPYGGSIWQYYVKAWDSYGNTAQTGSGNVQIQVCVK